MNILKATYGSGDCALDVTERLQGYVKNGCLSLVVSNSLFTDPCPGNLKTLHFAYELPGSDRFYIHQTEEHGILIAPRIGGDRIGILYTNNSVPAKYLERVLRQLQKAAANIDIITCPWHPIEGNQFPEIPWPVYHESQHLTMSLQILKLLLTVRELGDYKYVFFLEHDVLYPEGYFDIEPFTEDVATYTNYVGLCENGFQTAPENLIALHLLTMQLPAAIEHFTSCVHRTLTERPGFMIEPVGRSWKKRESAEPIVHINHGNHFSIYHTFFSKKNLQTSHPYWGEFASWWN